MVFKFSGTQFCNSAISLIVSCSAGGLFSHPKTWSWVQVASFWST